MEVQFTPDVEKRLNEIVAQSGRGTAATLVQDVVEGYFEELAQTRHMLDGRYDDIKSGRVKLVPGDDVFARLQAKSEARRIKPGA